jgi:pimeloyl-ACP methyl ester carboxylesterase
MIVRPVAGMAPPPPLLAAYAEVSPDGAEHFPVVIDKIVASINSESGLKPSELDGVMCPVLVMGADDDIVTLEHTLALYRGLPDAQLAIVPATSHLLLHEKPALCTRLVTDFLSDEPSPTWMPIRRAPRRPDNRRPGRILALY